MKDFKGRECSSRHFRRGNQLVPVLIPLDWKNDWKKLNRQCSQTGQEVISEEQYWQWREEQEHSHSSKGILKNIKKYIQVLKSRLRKGKHS